MRLFEDVSPQTRDLVECAVRPWRLRAVHRDPSSLDIVATISLGLEVCRDAVSPQAVLDIMSIKPLARVRYVGPYAPRRAMKARTGL